MSTKRRRLSTKSKKQEEPLVVLVNEGPRHPFHICREKDCRSLVRVNKLEEKFFPKEEIGFECGVGPTYSNECTMKGYTCPSCGEFNALWSPNEYTAEELKEEN